MSNNWRKELPPSIIPDEQGEIYPLPGNAVFKIEDFLTVWPHNVPNAWGLDYNDVALAPHVTKLSTRKNFDFSISVGRHAFPTRIMSANMDIASEDFAREVYRCGGIPTFPAAHNGDATELGGIANRLSKDGVIAMYSINGKGDPIENARILTANGAEHIIIEIAHGGLDDFLRLGVGIKEATDAFVIAGNVSEAEQIEWYNKYGLDGAKLSIGTGSICSTPETTSIYGSTLSSILAARQANNRSTGHKTLLIADGGIKYPADVVKALVAGADLTMMGRQFARTKEAMVPLINGKRMYYGSASETSMQIRGKEKSVNSGAEGVTREVPADSTVQKLMETYWAGASSASTYLNARNVDEMRQNAQFKLITSEAFKKSHPHA